ncbi:integral membrane sensor signal transduction histidine kinase [Crinalium epipsammum PCC 9333]|uniref:histidine kinase n=1 Tax=Crinalium epipsammum PCC 9333 TaxID=1173022 RepID=K9W401_9CYAN|nr:two-component system sensor histidine kinase RppB [Crinalium epipsammum]AFZ14160.1 integral membrane sensor signal transduction histidine kinase [Crinalium epipsammum PCC 9333]
MNQNKLFYITRARLALWYAGVMGVILSLCGIGVYEAIAHAHWVAIDQELKSVAGTLHDSLELKLKQPGKIELIVKQLLPDICLANQKCLPTQTSSPRHILGATNQGIYYIRLFNNTGSLIAIAGVNPQGLSPIFKNQLWQTKKDNLGNRYQQISLSLHTQKNQDWGYLQVGRNLADFDNYLTDVRWVLLVGLPISMGLIAICSWWLSGLAMQPIYKSYQQIKQFTADVAHELRTPLAATQATVESVLRMPELSTKEAQDILKTIERQNRRLIQLVNDLLLLARLDRQAVPAQRQNCCLNDLVSDLVEELEALAIAAKLTLTSDLRVDQPLYVVGDEEQLYRCCSNLIINAIQYTPATGKICVILDCSNHHALIHVIDTGVGIAPQDITRIFERFYRVQSDRSRHTGGSGLGLAIANAIAQAHHGSLQVQSELGKGSTFTIQLPLSFN